MSILISLSDEMFLDCETPAEAVEILRGLGVSPAGALTDFIHKATRPIEKAPEPCAPRGNRQPAKPYAMMSGSEAVLSVLSSPGTALATVAEMEKITGLRRKVLSNGCDYLRRTGRAKRRPSGQWELTGE